MRKPILTPTINHRNFRLCKGKLESLGRMLPPETAILIVGPSHSGKSLLLGYLISSLLEHAFAKADPRHTPIIGFTAQTSREGRTAPKFALHELLEEVGHPFFQPNLLDGGKPTYRPSLRLDETFSLRALKQSLHIANVSLVAADDGHNLVRSKDESFKASLLESFKSLITPRTSLVMCGGYELAEVALAYRAHFASRVIIIHLPRYSDSETDHQEWLIALGEFSRSPLLRLANPDLLVSNSRKLLHECHGVIGLLEKRLVDAQANADARGADLSQQDLDETTPTTAAWDTIHNDIAKGESLLGTKVGAIELPPPPAHTELKATPNKNKKKRSTRLKRGPYERVPRRTQPAVKT